MARKRPPRNAKKKKEVKKASPVKAKNTYNSKAIESIFGPPKKSFKKSATNQNGNKSSNSSKTKKSKQKKERAKQQQQQQQLQLQQAQRKKMTAMMMKKGPKKQKGSGGSNNNNSKVNKCVRKFKLQLPDVAPNCEPAPWWIDGSSSTRTRSACNPSSFRDNKNKSSSSTTRTNKILKAITVNDESMKLLNEELIAFANYVKLGNFEIQSRYYLIKIIQDISKQLWPHVESTDCQIFGSFAAQDVCTFESDIDMAIWNVVPPPPPSSAAAALPSSSCPIQSQPQSEEELESEGDDDDSSDDDGDDDSDDSKFNHDGNKMLKEDESGVDQKKQPQKQNDSDLGKTTLKKGGAPIVHSNQRKQAKIQKWMAALDDHFGLHASVEVEQQQHQQQQNSADSIAEEKKQEKTTLPLEEGEKPTKEAKNDDEPCLFVIDRVGGPNFDDLEQQQQQEQQLQNESLESRDRDHDLVTTQQQQTNKNCESVVLSNEIVADGSTEAAMTVSEDSFPDMEPSQFEDADVVETDGIPTENSEAEEEEEMQVVIVDETSSPASEEISSQFADADDTSVKDTQFEDAQDEEEAEDDNSSVPRYEGFVDNSCDGEGDDSDNDSADKLEALKKRSRALSCDSETRLFNLPDTEDEVLCRIPPNPSVPSRAINGEEEGKGGENTETDDSDDNNEDELEIVRKPRSHSMISLSSSTTAGSGERRDDDFDSSGMEVSFVTMPSAAAAIRGAATSTFGPTGETRVLINRRLNLLQKWLRRSGTIEQSHVRKNARIPIVNMLTCFGYEVDIAIGGHNGTDTSSYATSQIERFESFSPVVLFLKVLLSQNDLDKPFSGGLGSFKLYVLVANHIERHLRLGGSDSPGEILLTFLFRYGDVRGFDNINKCARTSLSQFEVVSAAGGTAEMSGVFQVQNCITVFAASWHRLQSKLKRQVNPRHSLLRYLVDPDKLQARREKSQTKAKLINRFSQSSVTPQNRRTVRCHSMPPLRPSPPPTENFDPPPSVLRGTLSYNTDRRRHRHQIRGMWNYENSNAFPPQFFELVRILDPTEDPTELPKDGEFHGSFSLPYYHTTSKGKQIERKKVIPESGVNIEFTKIEGGEGGFKLDGKGTNEYGIFSINGTANLCPHNDAEYQIVLRKRYETSAQPAVPAESDTSNKKSKKRKIGNISAGTNGTKDKEGGPLPPPSAAVPDRTYHNQDEDIAYLDTDEEAQQLKASYGERPSSSSSPSSLSKKPKKRRGRGRSKKQKPQQRTKA